VTVKLNAIPAFVQKAPPRLALCLISALCLSHALVAQSGEDAPSYLDVAEAGRGSSGSPYIPVDSWIYPAAIRLYDLGYLPTAFLGIRPWTRVSLAHMLSLSQAAILKTSPDSEAAGIFDRLHSELRPEMDGSISPLAQVESIYSRVREIRGPILNDSYHAGQGVINDYGRPYQPGFNNITGYAVRATSGRFDLSVRGEYQHSPSAAGYTSQQALTLATIDSASLVPQATIPEGPIPTRNQARLLEANLSAHLMGHQISFGKSDAWYSPAQGASMAWSNNAENIYSFRINRIEPLYVPLLSRLTGLFRYDFMVGSLKGHADPNDPWIHAEKINFKPTPDLEFGFERSVIWGGKGHVPITLHTFLRSFFSTTGVEPAVKLSRLDPGARFSTFDANWRIPWRSHLVTIYLDSLVHDNVFPVSNPGRAGYRPGLLITRLPALPKVDLRMEGTTTDPHDPQSSGGFLLYTEYVQKQGYTNRGQIIGDWIGREGKGGQAWLTWHQRPAQYVQLEYRYAKVEVDFVPGGTTQHSLALNTLFRPRPDMEVKGSIEGQFWKAPFVTPGQQKTFIGTIQIQYFPHLSKQR
jgi:hypothetical protein